MDLFREFADRFRCKLNLLFICDFRCAVALLRAIAPEVSMAAAGNYEFCKICAGEGGRTDT